MAAMVLNIFAALMALQMLLVASQAPESCPIYTCPNGDRPIIFQQPPPLFSRIDTADDLAPSATSAQQSSSGYHMGPNEISESAQSFSREILKVSFVFS